jgi:hypothetical protein
MSFPWQSSPFFTQLAMSWLVQPRFFTHHLIEFPKGDVFSADAPFQITFKCVKIQ